MGKSYYGINAIVSIPHNDGVRVTSISSLFGISLLTMIDIRFEEESFTRHSGVSQPLL